ncbi:MAG: hypothetical protein NDP16_06240 [Crenarchaeota archaeon]|nr:hypothetical protein [Thermoproteota archaeon]MCR8463725.1 hypothetical protein [Thermoproteota archaeon]MCR8471263.1 hypothetical protein [Thermoproteota archaeon]MCR8472621.1 hypothetical protein [Thermoproteota archaeon]MCR8473737.1 hypothetical protein [Thermoproteota archaeon]
MLPIVIIKDRAFEGEAIKILLEIAKKLGVDIIKIVRMKEKAVVIYNSDACFPNSKLEDIIVSNPAIYLTCDSIEDGIQIEKKEDLLKLENELPLRLRIINIYSKLPRLDCGRCGLRSCLEFAKSVVNNERELSNCPILSAERKVLISLHGKRIFLMPWVERLFRSLVFAFLSNLKGVNLKGDEKIILEVRE